MQGYRHIYLSPHLDDAALSCGGRIHQLARTGSPVLVVTIFAGSSRFDGQAGSEFVDSLHRRWGGEPDAPAMRRAEDAAAMLRLGAAYQHLFFLDCVYRQNPITAEFLYRSDDAIFGTVHVGEFLLAGKVKSALEDLLGAPGSFTLYAPLAAGHHVDHQIVVAAALGLQANGHRVVFYEDYPYVEEPLALSVARRQVGGANWQQELWPLGSQDLDAKAEAVLCYRSQISTFFDGDEQVAQRLRAYALGAGLGQGPCESTWHLTK